MRTADAPSRSRTPRRRPPPGPSSPVRAPRRLSRPARWALAGVALVLGTVAVLFVAAVIAVIALVNMAGNGPEQAVADCPDSPVAILRAAYAGDGALVADLVDQGRLHDIDNDERTALYCAARGGQPAVVDQLLAAGADANRRNAAGDTALLWAAQEGDLAMVDSLLAAGADLDLATDAGHTPLLRAVYGGHTTVVQRLLDAGADPDIPAGIDSMQASLLLTGVLAGEPLDASHDPFAEVPVGGPSQLPPVTGTSGDGVTALHVAVALQRTDLVAALLDAGAATDAQALGAYTPLHVAALVGDVANAEALLHAGADPAPVSDPAALRPVPKPADLAEQMGHADVAEVIDRAAVRAAER
jgi:ankyrin repeat protein